MEPQERGRRPAGRDDDPIRAESPSEALAIQEELRHRCSTARTVETAAIRSVAGADATYTGDRVFAGVVVLAFPSLAVVETACAEREVTFPYIPGLLSFREGPAILAACSRLTALPDLLLLNGHGTAHPRRFGLACHIGVVLGIPTVGVAQNLMTGTAVPPGPEPGSAWPVLDAGETIGMAVRTVRGSKPVFVSSGHKTDLAQAVEIAVRTTREHRITEPLWHADRMARECKDRSRQSVRAGGLKGYKKKDPKKGDVTEMPCSPDFQARENTGKFHSTDPKRVSYPRAITDAPRRGALPKRLLTTSRGMGRNRSANSPIRGRIRSGL